MTHADQGYRELNPLHRADCAPDILQLARLMPLGTAVGAAASALALWADLSSNAAAWWLAAGCAVAVLQWALPRRAAWGRTPAERDSAASAWLVMSALAGGLFWSAAYWLLLPADAFAQRLVLVCVLAGIAVISFPIFVLVRGSLLAFAAPVLLPIAFALTTSPQGSQATMGSLLLLLFAAFGAATRATSAIVCADRAARRALYHEATHDALVGLANRAEFYRRVALVDALETRPYAILFVDLDNFKAVNDTAGHAVGDELLRQVGAVLKLCVRKGDTAARLGGDEFAILMEDCGARDAALVAGVILERINALHLSRLGNAYGVSASIGIACHPHVGDSAQCVLEAADHACYAAKRTGRNRIEIAGAAPVQPAFEPKTARVTPVESKLARVAASHV